MKKLLILFLCAFIDVKPARISSKFLKIYQVASKIKPWPLSVNAPENFCSKKPTSHVEQAARKIRDKANLKVHRAWANIPEEEKSVLMIKKLIISRQFEPNLTNKLCAFGCGIANAHQFNNSIDFQLNQFETDNAYSRVNGLKINAIPNYICGTAEVGIGTKYSLGCIDLHHTILHELTHLKFMDAGVISYNERTAEYSQAVEARADAYADTGMRIDVDQVKDLFMFDNYERSIVPGLDSHPSKEERQASSLKNIELIANAEKQDLIGTKRIVVT